MNHQCCGGHHGCCGEKETEAIDKSGKLCHVCDEKFSVSAVSKFVSNPTHICDCCGRVSNDPAKLCSPVDLES